MAGAITTRMFMFSCFLLLFPSYLFADDLSSSLKDQKDKEGYSIGYQVGRSMKNDGVEVDLEKLTQGLKDAMNDKEPLLTEEEMKGLIVDLKKRARDTQLRKAQDEMVKNAQESEKFLEENGKKEDIRTTESGLQYKVIRDGDGPVPEPDDFVTVNYRGSFIDGTEFDSSYARGEPQTVRTNGVIRGWTEALQMMKTGSKWRIFVPPHLAYGRTGLGQRIPPNKALVFEIELISVKKGDKQEKQGWNSEPVQTEDAKDISR